MKVALLFAIAVVILSSIPFFAHPFPAPASTGGPHHGAILSSPAASGVLSASQRSAALRSGTQIALSVPAHAGR